MMNRITLSIAAQVLVICLGTVLFAQTRPADETVFDGEVQVAGVGALHLEVVAATGLPQSVARTTASVEGKSTQWELLLRPMRVTEKMARANARYPDGRFPTDGAMYELYRWTTDQPEAKTLVWRKFHPSEWDNIPPQWSGAVIWDPAEERLFIAISNLYGFRVFAVGKAYQPRSQPDEYARRGYLTYTDTDTVWGRHFPPFLGPREIFPTVRQGCLRWQREGDLLVLINTDGDAIDHRYVLSPAKAQWIIWGEPVKPDVKQGREKETD